MDDRPERLIPVACTLDAADATAQLSDWAALQPLCTDVERLTTHVVLWFEESAEDRLRSVVEREASCCQLLTLALRHEVGLLGLEISSATPAGAPVIEMLAAQASGR